MTNILTRTKVLWRGKENGRQRVGKYRDIYREMELIKENEELLTNFEFNQRSFLMPDNFSKEEFLSLGFKTFHISNVLVFLSLVRNITKFKEVVIKDQESFARINSIVLSEFLLTLSNGTKNFLTILERAGWIKVDHSYKVSSKSKGYRLGVKFENAKWIKSDWRGTLENLIPELTKKSNIARKKEIHYSLWDRACLYFMTWQNMEEGDLKEICRITQEKGRKLRINHCPELDETIFRCAAEHIEEERKDGTLGKNWTLEKQIENYRSSLSLFDGENFSVTCHDNRFENYTNRLFSNLVNLKSEFRKFVQLDGKSFVNVDIRSCQVALLATFYKPEDFSEKEKFQKIVCDEDIYLFLSPDKNQRKQAKIDMFHAMFDRTANLGGETYDKFKAEFPILEKRIADHKKDNTYKAVAREMQLKESSIMISKVLYQLLFKNKLECFSIHDSIFCFLEDSKLVKDVIFSFFSAEMGFCPKIKID